ncbi:MAG: type II pantothenate kinase [Clostridia bacterium]|nr:type II pantothenate kinase [Clostridia bacterium]
MGVVIGIDVGGSTTKIVGFDESGKLLDPLFVKAADPITSIYGAFGKFTDANSLELDMIERVMITGVGSSYISKPIYGLNCSHVPEFPSVGRGGLYLSKLSEAIVVSMGTGTALIHANDKGMTDYLGGTGVGGGTVMGLSKKMLGVDETDTVFSLAEQGNLDNIDLRIKDITKKDILPGMPINMTAANFGKVEDLATKEDTALGILNMVFETVGMLSVFAARSHGIKDIVLTGNLTTREIAKTTFDGMGRMFGVDFMIPDLSQFGTVIGAALLGMEEKKK